MVKTGSGVQMFSVFRLYFDLGLFNLELNLSSLLVDIIYEGLVVCHLEFLGCFKVFFVCFCSHYKYVLEQEASGKPKSCQ